MNTEAQQNNKVHHGRNIKRLREMLGMKQDAIASELNITQQSFSEIEQKKEINEKTLKKIAQVLNIPVESIKNMTEESTYNYISTFYDSSVSNGPYHECTFNPLDKIVELYERMLKTEQDKVILLEKMLSDKI